MVSLCLKLYQSNTNKRIKLKTLSLTFGKMCLFSESVFKTKLVLISGNNIKWSTILFLSDTSFFTVTKTEIMLQILIIYTTIHK